MKLNNRFLFGILSILLAAIIAFVALPTISRQTNGKTEIVRVTQPVLKGAAIPGCKRNTLDAVSICTSFIPSRNPTAWNTRSGAGYG